MTYGSLFAGIGGIDLGLDRAGLECRWQVENDGYCVKVLASHWPEVKRYGDIRQIGGQDLEYVDLVCGGFPCQDLSQAGKGTGLVHADGTPTRSGLWFEYARIIGLLRPRYVLAENVPGLLVHSAMGRVIGDLARLGYVGCWRSLRA
ncbi:MAG TPA: DNA (cytosine-5-)-methyltransferase, partial [Candidatus Sulfotelmatobacter sp.]